MNGIITPLAAPLSFAPADVGLVLAVASIATAMNIPTRVP